MTEKTNVIEIADRIQKCLRDEWIIANEKIKITSSIGISFYSQFDLEEKTLFKNADLALYEARKREEIIIKSIMNKKPANNKLAGFYFLKVVTR